MKSFTFTYLYFNPYCKIQLLLQRRKNSDFHFPAFLLVCFRIRTLLAESMKIDTADTTTKHTMAKTVAISATQKVKVTIGEQLLYAISSINLVIDSNFPIRIH